MEIILQLPQQDIIDQLIHSWGRIFTGGLAAVEAEAVGRWSCRRQWRKSKDSTSNWSLLVVSEDRRGGKSVFFIFLWGCQSFSLGGRMMVVVLELGIRGLEESNSVMQL
ncbi:hypothetical protein Dimus_030167 [Dionaea muscipula]